MIATSKPASSSGILMSGPGALKLQIPLPPLTSQQIEVLNKARRYASDETARFIHSNQPLVSTVATNVQLSPPPNKTLQRHQAIQLMSRVYVGSISFEVKEDMLKAAFSKYGPVKSVNMSWDINTGKHKGFAFVEFDLPESAGLAIERMNGIKLGNRQIKVGRPSNMPQATEMLEEIRQESERENRIYIANIHPEFDDLDMITLMEPFGDILNCTIQLDEIQRKSFGYIQFRNKLDADEALSADKLDLGDYILNICKAITPLEPSSTSEVAGSVNNNDNINNDNHSNDIDNNDKKAQVNDHSGTIVDKCNSESNNNQEPLSHDDGSIHHGMDNMNDVDMELEDSDDAGDDEPRGQFVDSHDRRDHDENPPSTYTNG